VAALVIGIGFAFAGMKWHPVFFIFAVACAIVAAFLLLRGLRQWSLVEVLYLGPGRLECAATSLFGTNHGGVSGGKIAIVSRRMLSPQNSPVHELLACRHGQQPVGFGSGIGPEAQKWLVSRVESILNGRPVEQR